MRAIVFLAVLGLALPAMGAEVRLRSSVACPYAVVRLADVAEIRADDEATAEALGAIPLCPAPASQAEKKLSQHQVRSLLALSGVESKQVTVTGSDEVVLLPDAAGSSTSRPVTAAGAVRQALYSLESPPARSATKIPDANFPATDTTTKTNASATRLVERGAIVTVHSQRPGVRITATGKALAAGSAGETIPIEMTDSRDKLFCRIQSAQHVEVATQEPKPVAQAAVNP